MNCYNAGMLILFFFYAGLSDASIFVESHIFN